MGIILVLWVCSGYDTGIVRLSYVNDMGKACYRYSMTMTLVSKGNI